MFYASKKKILQMNAFAAAAFIQRDLQMNNGIAKTCFG